MNSVEFPRVYPVTCHTDHVGQGSVFIAIQGQKENGVNYIPMALAKGASYIVVAQDAQLSPELQDLIVDARAELFRVENTRRALAAMSAQMYGFPARKLNIIGITGTKGKTTSSFLLEHALRSLGYKTALLSTVHNKIGTQIFPTTLTTQQPDYLHAFFDQCVKAGVQFVVMEVAAQAHSLERVFGIEFCGMLFTNFSEEHAEFYATIQDYFAAKTALLEQVKPRGAIVLNADDQWCTRIAQRSNCTYSWFGMNAGTKQSDITAHSVNSSFDGINCMVTMHDEKPMHINTPLIGTFNVYNCIGVMALCNALGINAAHVAATFATFNGVPGRLDRYALPNGAHCFIDYAHNPSSYSSVLSTLRAFTHNLIVVFGAGGDRDPFKRPVMGDIATQIADVVILTSDNPRSENPQTIINDILGGIAPENKHKVHCELDREVAIKKAYALSDERSIIVLLGKGPDEYQLVQGVKTPFSEKAILKSLA